MDFSRKLNLKNAEFLFAVLYTFRFVLKIFGYNNGNYDIFYLVGIYAFLSVVLKYKSVFYSILKVVVVLAVISIINKLFGVINIDVNKNIVWIIKFSICYSIFLLSKKRADGFSLSKFVDYCGAITLIEIIFALFLRNNVLWRTSENRLQLFYIEPSDLGMFIGLLVVLCIYQIINLRKLRRKCNKKYFDLVVFLIAILLSQSAAGFLYVFVGCIIVLFWDVLTFKTTSKSFIKFFLLILILIVGSSFIVISDSYIANRVLQIANGTDSSFFTRVTYSYDKVISFYKNTSVIGCGFGNQNSVFGNSYFKYNNADSLTTCAAFASFMLEGGILGFIVLILYILRYIKKLRLIKCDVSLRWSIFVICFLYLFTGGYLTNPALWCVIGLISGQTNLFEGNYRSRKNGLN